MPDIGPIPQDKPKHVGWSIESIEDVKINVSLGFQEFWKSGQLFQVEWCTVTKTDHRFVDFFHAGACKTKSNIAKQGLSIVSSLKSSKPRRQSIDRMSIELRTEAQFLNLRQFPLPPGFHTELLISLKLVRSIQKISGTVLRCKILKLGGTNCRMSDNALHFYLPPQLPRSLPCRHFVLSKTRLQYAPTPGPVQCKYDGGKDFGNTQTQSNTHTHTVLIICVMFFTGPRM